MIGSHRVIAIYRILLTLLESFFSSTVDHSRFKPYHVFLCEKTGHYLVTPAQMPPTRMFVSSVDDTIASHNQNAYLVP